jgi:hypothetical protein
MSVEDQYHQAFGSSALETINITTTDGKHCWQESLEVKITMLD